jgi:ribosomal protein L22
VLEDKMSIEAMRQALEALEMLARYENPETRIQVRKPKDGGPIVTMYPHKVATDAADGLRTAIEEAQKRVQLTVRDFVVTVGGIEDAVGEPIYWAEWPNRGQA